MYLSSFTVIKLNGQGRTSLISTPHLQNARIFAKIFSWEMMSLCQFDITTLKNQNRLHMSKKIISTTYNLFTSNCNHFFSTDFLFRTHIYSIDHKQ